MSIKAQIPRLTIARLVVRYAVALIALFILILGAVASARAGLSRLLSEYGSAKDSLAATSRALDFNAGDPEAHYAQAVALSDANRNEEAVREFERAVSLRPQERRPLPWLGVFSALRRAPRN